MAKAAPGMRLLRSLARASKSQQKLVASLFAVPKPKPQPKSKPKPKPKPALQAKAQPKRAAAPAAKLAIREHARPEVRALPGKWLAAQYRLPASEGHAAGQQMSYWLYLPDHVPERAARSGLPLLVMLHGCQQSATQFAQGTRMNRLAEEKGYAVLYPQQSASAHAQRCWKWYDRATQEGGGDTRALAGLIEMVCAHHPIDRRRVYAAGISAGAGMANILALNHPELIAAVGLHSGPVFGGGHSTVGALQVMRHGTAGHHGAIRGVMARRPAFPVMPTLLIQGEGDQVVRPVNQRQLAQQSLLLNGVPAGTPVKVVAKPAGRGGSRLAHEIRDYLVGGKVVLRVASIDSLDHAWSGGDPELKFNSKAGPDASKMMLDFFGKHRRLVSRRKAVSAA
ncbi:extracellular catalytic domain type 1 short-chain-length polyhydroxyalkanoate depolymerase [Pseudoduganella namucuonensis]|uniref:Esterase, PHB depolymerase family n=1 Tax=Pseudoduganella namucuonensis TaxID=1035707 RepID=A0A1I7M322_9BURK|nr:PHB depolymerase family esterase [Pseudoduganella namucuonensis]SFV16341.1 esterase, PHB depolymerase family [Pseudoduganella namucuonensis]